jgi:hemerythrin-like domain-containing protein
MSRSLDSDRRRLIRTAGGFVLLGAGLTAVRAPGLAAERKADKDDRRDKDDKHDKHDKDEEVTPPEDLMREHGVLDRVLLIYEAGVAKFSANEDFDPAVLTRSAEIVRDFIENYHEKSEEEQVFPRFRQAGKMVDLVDTLLAQHQAGRRVTATILQSAPGSRKDGDDRRRLVTAMRSFIVMYRPHAAREDTDLFPKLRSLVSANEYDAMAEDFENKEHQLFGDDGFEKMVDRVAQLERTIGIHDLKQFTPRGT